MDDLEKYLRAQCDLWGSNFPLSQSEMDRLRELKLSPQEALSVVEDMDCGFTLAEALAALKARYIIAFLTKWVEKY